MYATIYPYFNVVKLTMRRVIHRSRRFFSTEGTAEKVITKETKNKDGTSILEKVNIVHRWNSMSKTKRIVLAVYGACATGSFFVATYNDGKSELVQRRANRTGPHRSMNDSIIEADSEKRTADDWTYVRKGCTQNAYYNFWSALFFPFRWVSDAMPKVVMLMNPEKRPEPSTIEPPKPSQTKWMKDSADENSSSPKN
jgi:hypothetical protein